MGKERDEERRGEKNRPRGSERGKERQKGAERETKRKRGKKKEGGRKKGRRECPLRLYFFRLLRVGSRVDTETQGARNTAQ